MLGSFPGVRNAAKARNRILRKPEKKNLLQGPLLYLILLLVILWMVQLLGSPTTDKIEELKYSTLLKWVEADLKADAGMALAADEVGKTIENVIITQSTLIARTKDSQIPVAEFGARYDLISTIPSEEQFYKDVNLIYEQVLGRALSPTDYAFEIETKLPAPTPWWMEWLPTIVMIGLVAVLWFFIMRAQTGSGKGMASFGKSRARLTDPKANGITFKDVAGADEEKEELKEIWIFENRRSSPTGARIPRACARCPRETGKTLAREGVYARLAAVL